MIRANRLRRWQQKLSLWSRGYGYPIARKHPEKGFSYFAGVVYKIVREGKPSRWYVVELDWESNPICVKRICNY